MYQNLNIKKVTFCHYAKMKLDINSKLIAVNLDPDQASILYDLDVARISKDYRSVNME